MSGFRFSVHTIHHHPFFFVPAYDDAGRRLFFVSNRTGAPQIFFEDRETDELVQVTDRNDLADWSICPSRDGYFVYFTAGTGAWRADLDTFAETQLTRRYCYSSELPKIGPAACKSLGRFERDVAVNTESTIRT
jgi:Tol biopolymer transport system component